MNCSLAERLAAARREEAAPIPPLVAWVRRYLPDAAVWPPQRGRGEKEPASDPREGVRVFRDVILRVGARRFGPPPTAVRAAIEAVTDSEQLEALLDRLVVVGSWNELLAR
jgi:hypothetical protein